MVSETFAAPADTPSQLPDAPSETPELTPSEITPDAEPAETQDEITPADEDENPEPEQPKEPNLETALDKRKAIDRGDEDVTMTAAELRLLREHDRAEDNRRRDFERKQEEERQQIESLTSMHDGTTDELVDEVMNLAQWVQRFGDPDDFTKQALRDRIANRTGKLKESAKDIILKPHLQSQRDLLTRAYGDNPSTETLRTISGLQSQEQILSHAYEMGRAYGQTEGAPEGKVLVDKKDHDRWTKADQAEDKSRNPDKVPPGGRSSRQTRTTPLTYEEAMSLPVEELQRIRAQERGQ